MLVKSFETNEFNRDLKTIYFFEDQIEIDEGKDVTCDAIMEAFKQGRLFSGREPGAGV